MVTLYPRPNLITQHISSSISQKDTRTAVDGACGDEDKGPAQYRRLGQAWSFLSRFAFSPPTPIHRSIYPSLPPFLPAPFPPSTHPPARQPSCSPTTIARRSPSPISLIPPATARHSHVGKIAVATLAIAAGWRAAESQDLAAPAST